MSECEFCYFDSAKTVRWNHRDPARGYRLRPNVPKGEIPVDQRVGLFSGAEHQLTGRSMELLEIALINKSSLGRLAARVQQRIEAAKKNVDVSRTFEDVEMQLLHEAEGLVREQFVGLLYDPIDKRVPPVSNDVDQIATAHRPSKYKDAFVSTFAAFARRRLDFALALAPLEGEVFSSRRRLIEALVNKAPEPELEPYRVLAASYARQSSASLYCGSCSNGIMVCDECAYRERHLCTECGDCACAACLSWPKFQEFKLSKPCPDCASAEDEDDLVSNVQRVKDPIDELLSSSLVTRCSRPTGPLFVLKRTTPRILVVSDGVHFDYSTRLANTKLASEDVFVLATQFDFTGWPSGRTRPLRDRFTIWERSFDVTNVEHWNAIRSDFGPFRAIIFNNPLIGYYFHRIYAKGTNSQFETWEAIHSLADAWPPWSPSRTDNCFCPREHADPDGNVADYTKAASAEQCAAIDWKQVYEPIGSAEDYRDPYHSGGVLYQGRAFTYNCSYQRSTNEQILGYQYFILRQYRDLGVKALGPGGTIEVNAPGVLQPTLVDDLGFTPKGSFQNGPYGQEFDVELTHYGWHTSWPMFDRMDPECGPQDGRVRDMNRYIIKSTA